MNYITANKISKSILALILAAVLLTVFCVASAADQKSLSMRLIRLHVIANSDSPDDQALKLRVRDAVLAEADLLGLERSAVGEYELELLRRAAREEILSDGYDYDVSVTLGSEWYGTRIYDEFALPPGYYSSLRVKIGAGGGQNWWCVLFPPLCFSTAEETVQTAQAAGFSDDEISLITGSDEGYVVRFKCVELFWKLVDFIKGDSL